MKLSWIFITILLLYLAGFLAHAYVVNKTVYGDGMYYFSWLRSLALDRDINFTNEYTALGLVQPATQQNLPANKYSIGPALVWLPFYLMLHNFYQGQGYEFPYQLVAGITSVFAAVAGLLLLHRILVKYFNQTLSSLAIVSVAFATNLFFYGSLDTVNSHAVSFFAATVFLSLVFSATKNWFAIGLALAFVGLMRLQDVTYALLLLPYLKKIHWKALLAGFAIGFLPQLTSWQILYGQFWISPYLTGGERFYPFTPHILQVLFSVKNGLFTWTPLALLGLIGLLFLPTKLHKWHLLAVFIAAVYTVGSWIIWWQGASYSGRMFVSLLPALTIGLTQFFAVLKKYHWTTKYYLFIFVIPLSIINFFMMAYFLYRL